MRRASAAIATLALLVGCASEPPTRGGLTDLGATGRAVVIDSQRWSFEGSPGRIDTTPSFRIYTTGAPNATTDRLPIFLEAALGRYTTALGDLPRPSSRLETYMMGTRAEWERLTQRTMGDNADTYLRIVRGGYAARGRGVYFNIGPRDSFLIAAHEGWHQYTQSTFKQPLPVWLEEGVAVYMEGFRWNPASPDRPEFLPWSNPERFDHLRDAANAGRLLTLGQLVSTTPQQQMRRGSDDILTYYAQLWALVHFLSAGENAHHAPSLAAILSDAARGRMTRTMAPRLGAARAGRAVSARVGPDALLAYFAESIDTPTLRDLESRYEAYVWEIVRTGTRHDIVAGRSPVD